MRRAWWILLLVGGCERGRDPRATIAPAVSVAPPAPAPPPAPPPPPMPVPPSAAAPPPDPLPPPAPKGGLRFIAVGDTGTGDAAQYQVAEAMARKCAADGCDFVQLLGDNLYENGADSADDPQFQSKFEVPYRAIDRPFWVVLGNHDYGAFGGGVDERRPEAELAYAARGGKWRMPGRYWHRQDKGVEMVGLDTNGELFGFVPRQRAEVRGWLGASRARWKIGFGHHGYHSNGFHGNAGAFDGNGPDVPHAGARLRRFFDEDLCGKLDLYVAGHDHDQQWLAEGCQGTALLVEGAGAKSAPLTHAQAARYQSERLGFSYLVVQDAAITVEMIDATGRLEYRGTIPHR